MDPNIQRIPQIDPNIHWIPNIDANQPMDARARSQQSMPLLKMDPNTYRIPKIDPNVKWFPKTMQSQKYNQMPNRSPKSIQTSNGSQGYQKLKN